MQVFVTGLEGEVELIDAVPESTLGQLKALLGITNEVLYFGSKVLDDDSAALTDYELHHGSTLNVNARLVGGKVHGSLARAGKVRAQTPKVEKQEKKKKKTGRAARRIQYNRRFVNVAVSGPGRKRGPNSNAA
ncbi:unnamed protein product [Enterobius vermicularis]|uniref:40S ribosomal protein S30 n=1 Tax=Enterobius vermicularis TaxID=51028 RepID=A0A0N4VKI6_ENTVE|nr:unnamed protein product [Enterobius vermicularis]